MCSADYLVSLTYMSDLWQLTDVTTGKIKEFRFSLQQLESQKANEVWRLVSDVRDEIHPSKYDAYVRSLFSLFDKNVNPNTQFNDINVVWNRLMDIFGIIRGLVTYAPAFKAYYKNAMQEMMDDGVQYLEFRGQLSKVIFFQV